MGLLSREKCSRARHRGIMPFLALSRLRRKDLRPRQAWALEQDSISELMGRFEIGHGASSNTVVGGTLGGGEEERWGRV